MFWIVIHSLVGNAELRPGGQWLATACIARETRVCAAGDLDAKTLTLAEMISGCPEVDRDAQAAISFWGDTARRQAQDAIAEIDGFTRYLYDTQPGEEIRVFQA